MIERIIKQLLIDEGIELFPYDDSEGLLTIGIGRCLETNGLSWGEMVSLIELNPERKMRFPDNYREMKGEALMTMIIKDMQLHGITRTEAFALCKNDVVNAIEDLKENLPWYDNSPVELKEILVNMVFNMGIGNLPTLVKKGKGLLSFGGKGGTLFLLSIGQYDKAADNLEKSKWRRQTKRRADRLIQRIRNLSKKQ